MIGAVSSDLMIAGDVIVLSLLLGVWSLSVVVFWRRWKRFRLLGPRVVDVYQQPKNMESVTVVRRPDESVIYTSYNQHVVTALQVVHNHIISHLLRIECST